MCVHSLWTVILTRQQWSDACRCAQHRFASSGNSVDPDQACCEVGVEQLACAKILCLHPSVVVWSFSVVWGQLRAATQHHLTCCAGPCASHVSPVPAQVAVDSVIGELEDARRSAEADENAALQLQATLGREKAAVAKLRCALMGLARAPWSPLLCSGQCHIPPGVS